MSKEQVPFTKEKINFIASLLNKYDLDARLMIGYLNDDWTDVQRQLYAVPHQQGEIYIVPMRANPNYCMGLTATTEATEDGIVVSTTMTEKALSVPHDVIPIELDSVIAIQIRGLKWNGEPACVFVTCDKKSWEDKLVKRLEKLKPIKQASNRTYHWDLITDAKVI